ncbi:UvrD-helicase domain-containing protein [Providencia alcalifaciens]|uniref:ATP-dependent helicase n=1 Tax=Providencia alcalifaciens TaxID=126385 RepID=UPI0032DB6BEA
MNLTKEQLDAIDYDGNLVITACPGSGKTTILVHKIAACLSHSKDYQGVIALSYTNKSSEELKVRCRKLGAKLNSSLFGTIDKFLINEIILPFVRQVWGKNKNTLEIVKYIDLPQELKDNTNKYFERDEFYSNTSFNGMNSLKNIYLKGQLILDFLPHLAFYIVRTSYSCQRYLMARYISFFIDEYQDTDYFTHQVFKLIPTLGMPLIIVGDLDQSIYLYSHRSSDSLKDFMSDSSFCHKEITVNHRCHPSIVNYANRIKDSKCQLVPCDENFVYRKCVDGNQIDIVKWIGKVIDKVKNKFSISDNKEVAILVRSNACAELVSDHLVVSNRAYLDNNLTKAGGKVSSLVNDLLCYKYNLNKTAQSILEGVLGNSVKRSEASRIRKAIKQVRSTTDTLLIDVINKIVVTLLGTELEQYHKSALSEILVTPRMQNNYLDVRSDEVQIMTLHKSKGLEFDFVFHLDLYDWILPKRVFIEGNYDVVFENEQQCINLHYVGITRARKGIVLIHSTKRYNALGDLKNGEPSQFLLKPGLDDLYKKIN